MPACLSLDPQMRYSGIAIEAIAVVSNAKRFADVIEMGGTARKDPPHQ